MSNRPEIEPEALAQARGCHPVNDCWSACVGLATDMLDRWGELDLAVQGWISAIATIRSASQGRTRP